MKPLAIDLYCGLGGWADGFIAEGYTVVGFDIERHDYGTGGYPGQLVLQDVLTLLGSQFKNAACIVASPPCQFFSYCAMPWTRAKELARRTRENQELLENELALFKACFRIQREACEAAGHHIPLIVENVRGAQKWVWKAAWNFGSYYLWGDVPALMPVALRAQKFNPDGTEHPPGSWFKIADSQNRGSKNSGGSWFAIGGPGQKVTGQNPDGRPIKTVGHANIHDGYSHTRHLTNQRESDGVKFSQSGDAWFDGTPRDKMLGDKGPSAYGSKSNSRKAASAMIAKIPFPLAQHIAKVFKCQRQIEIAGTATCADIIG